ncbi:hypothetical protein AAF712_016779, partial [Marasmius tenuissimus]
MPLAVASGWDTETVSTRCEGFAVAGCDTSKMALNKKAQAIMLQSEIKLIIDKKLGKFAIYNKKKDHLRGVIAEVLGVKNPAMEYVNFDKKMMYNKGVVCEGWPTQMKFIKPSDLGSATKPRRSLCDDWVEGRCYFWKLSPEEHNAWKASYNAKMKSREIPPKIRQPRSDAGKPRKKPAKESEEAVNNVDMDSGHDEDASTDDTGAETAGDIGNVDVKMHDNTSVPDATASSAVKAAKPKKKEGKSRRTTSKKKEKAAAAVSKAQKEAGLKKGKSKAVDTDPAPPSADTRPKARKKTKTMDSPLPPSIPPTASIPTPTEPPPDPSPTVISAPTESLPPQISASPIAPVITPVLGLNEEDSRLRTV